MIKIFHEEINNNRLLPFIINSTVYKRSTIDECDFIVYNDILWDAKNTTPLILKSLSKKYKPIDRFVIVFIVTDYEKKYKFFNNLILVRTSLKASIKRSNEFVLPYLWEHLAVPFSPILQETLSVGFCGWVSPYRKAIITVFGQSPTINANFILREKFWGLAQHDFGLNNDFNDNLKENPFIIAQRGTGNFSMRFYQTLTAGRIPILVDTDMILPFNDKIEWNKYIIFGKDEKACLNKTIEAFESGNYFQMQKDCYCIFNAYFSDTNFFENLINQIIQEFSNR